MTERAGAIFMDSAVVLVCRLWSNVPRRMGITVTRGLWEHLSGPKFTGFLGAEVVPEHTQILVYIRPPHAPIIYNTVRIPFFSLVKAYIYYIMTTSTI